MWYIETVIAGKKVQSYISNQKITQNCNEQERTTSERATNDFYASELKVTDTQTGKLSKLGVTVRITITNRCQTMPSESF